MPKIYNGIGFPLMDIKEATYLLERIDITGSDLITPFLSLDYISKYELYVYLLGKRKGKYKDKEIKKILEEKSYGYKKELKRSNSFIKGFYSPDYKEDEEVIIKDKDGNNQMAKTSELEKLTNLVIMISKIGSFNIQELTIYEAHRIWIMNYRSNIHSRIDQYMDLIKDKHYPTYEQTDLKLKDMEDQLIYIDVSNEILEDIEEIYEELKED